MNKEKKKVGVLLFQFVRHFRQHCNFGCIQLRLFASVTFVPAHRLQQVSEDDDEMRYAIH